MLVLAAASFGMSTFFRTTAEAASDSLMRATIQQIVASIRLGDGESDVVIEQIGQPQFLQPYSGYYWQVDSESSGSLQRSRSLWDVGLDAVETMDTQERIIQGSVGPRGDPIRRLVQSIILPGSDERYYISVAISDEIVYEDVTSLNLILWSALAAIALGLILTIAIQVYFTLEPINRIVSDLADVRSGKRRKLRTTVPLEIEPLVTEMNQLIDHNSEVVTRARTHVGNLAHAMKTPLSVLMNEAATARGALAGLVEKQTEMMRRHIDHYLIRARTAATSQNITARCAAKPVIESLIRALQRIYSREGVDIASDIPDGIGFRGEGQDLEEMIGNIIDNACKFSTSRVQVMVLEDNGQMSIIVEDDGPGIPDEKIAEVLKRGNRLDESVPGSGLGLSIIRDIANLYGGSLDMMRSHDLGGLRVVLNLPSTSLAETGDLAA